MGYGCIMGCKHNHKKMKIVIAMGTFDHGGMVAVGLNMLDPYNNIHIVTLCQTQGMGWVS